MSALRKPLSCLSPDQADELVRNYTQAVDPGMSETERLHLADDMIRHRIKHRKMFGWPRHLGCDMRMRIAEELAQALPVPRTVPDEHRIELPYQEIRRERDALRESLAFSRSAHLNTIRELYETKRVHAQELREARAFGGTTTDAMLAEMHGELEGSKRRHAATTEELGRLRGVLNATTMELDRLRETLKGQMK